MSPIMVSGVLRIFEFVLLLVSGLALFYHVGICLGACVALSGDYRAEHLADHRHFPRNFRLLPIVRTDAAGLAYRARSFWPGSARWRCSCLPGSSSRFLPIFHRLWFGGWFASGFILIFGGSPHPVTHDQALGAQRHDGAPGRHRRRRQGRGGAHPLPRAQPDNDVRICGIFDDRGDKRSPPLVAGYPKLGTIAELVEFGRIARLDMLIVSLPLAAEKRVLAMVKKLWVLPVDIRLSAHTNKLQFRPRSYSYIGCVPFLDVFDKPIADWDSLAKRGFDLVFGLVGIVIFSPVISPPRSPSSSTARGRSSSARSGSASTTRSSMSTSSARCTPNIADPSAAGVTGTTRASPASAASSARPRSTSCRSSSTR